MRTLLDYSQYPQVSGDLFRRVQEAGLFDDGKTFVDAEPRVAPDVVRERYRAARGDPTFDLRGFVEDHFRLPDTTAPSVDLGTGGPFEAYVDDFWTTFAREFDADPTVGGTLLSLPNPHVVPGGRFREAYYWDSYFIAEGLAAAGRHALVAGLVENLASLIDRFGFVPLGNRVYYDSRTQAPLFYRMLRLLADARGVDAVEPYLRHLEREYEFWMAGAEGLGEGPTADQRVVRTADGHVVNRYWDARATPRPESYRVDRELAERVPVDDRPRLFRDLRAACESGWDFSSRWLRDPDDLATIRTTALAPVDCNAFCYGIETALAEWFTAVGKRDRGERYARAAERRRDAFDALFWDPEREFYVDFDWRADEHADPVVLAGVVPLFTGVAREDRAAPVAARLREWFLEEGGLVTSRYESGQQWDRPSGWAPLQWLAVLGLRRYGHDDLAAEIVDRWTDMVEATFDRTGVVAEKYDVFEGGPSGELGEYPLQYGFGWTNGVALAMRALS